VTLILAWVLVSSLSNWQRKSVQKSINCSRFFIVGPSLTKTGSSTMMISPGSRLRLANTPRRSIDEFLYTNIPNIDLIRILFWVGASRPVLQMFQGKFFSRLHCPLRFCCFTNLVISHHPSCHASQQRLIPAQILPAALTILDPL
jgi:hypothetical protein